MDAHKLDETIKEFESEVEKLKSVNEMYSKIEDVYKQIIYNVELYQNNNEELLSMKNELESIVKNYEKFQEKIEGLNRSIKESLEKDIASLRSENTQFNMGIIEGIEKLDGVYDKKLSEIRKENREIYNELENLLSSKLERIKSEIGRASCRERVL